MTITGSEQRRGLSSLSWTTSGPFSTGPTGTCTTCSTAAERTGGVSGGQVQTLGQVSDGTGSSAGGACGVQGRWQAG
jgi:hypothetical protein